MGETVAMTLTEFLLARIAEDEGVARANMTGGPHGTSYRRGVGGSLLVPPARVLAECEAKRRIVAYREQAVREHDVLNLPLTEVRTITYDAVLRALALPYADHPDYLEEWRP